MPRIRAAIVGTGNIARFHAESLHALHDEVEVVAAVDIDSARLAGSAPPTRSSISSPMSGRC